MSIEGHEEGCMTGLFLATGTLTTTDIVACVNFAGISAALSIIVLQIRQKYRW